MSSNKIENDISFLKLLAALVIVMLVKSRLFPTVDTLNLALSNFDEPIFNWSTTLKALGA